MGAIGILVICVSSCVCLYSLLALIRVLLKLCWTPIRMQFLMGSRELKILPWKHQGNFEHEKRSHEQAMDLSHDIMSKNFLLWNGPEAQMVLTEPELIKEILNNRDNAFPKQKTTEGFVKKLLGDGLVTSEAMITSVEVMLERWKHHEGKEIEVFEEFRLLTSELISRTAFGSSYLEGENIFQMLMKLTLLTSRNTYKLKFPGISKFYKTSDEIESEQLENEIFNSILEIIKKKEEKVMTEEVGSFGNDFLQLLVKAYHDANSSPKISIQDLVDECKTFYFAGQETTNSLLAWTVLLLAIHTDWQEEARKEVLNFFGHQNPNPDGITKLKTMGMIINESLRLYPPILSIVRKVERKTRLGKLTLPAELVLIISNIAVHHDPQVWGEDVHLFKPERFSEGVSKATNNNIAAFLPFGMGPRNCVGFNFATTETKIALSMILQRYAFTLSPAYVHSPFQLLTLRPQHGLQVLLHSL
ncbi:cytochrome p450 cyp749a22 [Quercus suber]|uniref:Cytochrome p450 cyp749a22 n=1 Tax=Quercus suber TaxID=58331 RepID=A0AAW0J5S2_QUESU